MSTPRPTVTIDFRRYDAAVTRAVVDAHGPGLSPDWVADGLTAEETIEALSALHRDGMLRRDEMDWCHPSEALFRALQIVHLP